MKKFLHLLKRTWLAGVAMTTAATAMAQGWPASYDGVMLQGFYWNSFNDTQWDNLTGQSDELARWFNLIWVPQSGRCNGTSMGYNVLYYFDQNSSFGTEAQLRNMISTFKKKGVGIIADVVVNHRDTVNTAVDFPRETYKGETYQMVSTDIVADDDEGATKRNNPNAKLSSNNDSGIGWNGMRDLDHYSSNVQKSVKAYENYLLNDLGYTGFRYDMALGFDVNVFADYNHTSGVQYSVAEYWLNNTESVTSWLDKCAVNGVKQSAAFDFPFRAAVRNAVNNTATGWRDLQVPGVISSSNHRRYAVTFVENHDTEARIDGNVQDPLKRDTLAANAFLLTMPGTPCVFLTHWKAHKSDITSMIALRHLAAINSQSNTRKLTTGSNANFAAFSTTGATGKTLGVIVGPAAASANAANISGLAGTVEVLSGHRYRMFLSAGCETAWVDRMDGSYPEPFEARLTAVTASAGARLVYTLDGSQPTAASTQVASGSTITIDKNCTLKVGLLTGGNVSGVVTRDYQVQSAGRTKISIYTNVDEVAWDRINYWSWGGDFSHAPQSGGWPGDNVTTTVKVGGKRWHVKNFYLSDDTDFVNLVFSTGNGAPQTVNEENVNTTSFFIISSEKSGDSHLINNVTADYIDLPVEDDTPEPGPQVTVNVHTSTGEAPNLYIWDSEGNQINGPWPGALMEQTTGTDDGLTWYTQTIDLETCNIIFNLNDVQTANIEGVSGVNYYEYDIETGEYTDVTSKYDGSDEPHEYTVPTQAVYLPGHVFAYFVKPASWADVYCWAWNGGDDVYEAWPGAQCVKIATDSNGDDVYLWDLGQNPPLVPNKIIFNNNGAPQTPDMDFVNGGYYMVSGLYTTIEPGTVATGDVDGNGVVNGSDVTALYNFLLNGNAVGGNADVDGNGTVNGSDVTTLYNILLR